MRTMTLFNFTFKPPSYRNVVGVKLSTYDLLRQRAPVPGLLIFGFSVITLVGVAPRHSTPEFWPAAAFCCIILGGLSYLIGIFYNSFSARKFITKLDYQFFIYKIKNILYDSGETLKISKWKKNKIINSSAIMDIFYDFVERDEFLHEIYNEFIKNKYYLILFFDIMIYSFSFSIISSLLILISSNPKFYLISMIFGSFVFCIGYYFYNKFYTENIALANQQIDFIVLRYGKELKEKIYVLYF